MILISWLATPVSTVATPAMSSTKTRARVSAILVSDLFITSAVRMESMIPTSGSSRIPSQMGVTGVDISCSDLCSSSRTLAASSASSMARLSW